MYIYIDTYIRIFTINSAKEREGESVRVECGMSAYEIGNAHVTGSLMILPVEFVIRVSLYYITVHVCVCICGRASDNRFICARIQGRDDQYFGM